MSGKFTKYNFFRSLIIVALIVAFLWALATNIRNAWPSVELAFVKRNPGLSYDEKMAIKIGSDFYYYAKFLASALPDDAVVYLPPFAIYPWPNTGNGAYMNYFLYPRQVVNGALSDQVLPDNVTHALLVWGETGAADPFLYGWPKIEIPVKRIIYFNPKTRQAVVLENTVYQPGDQRNQNAWGVIEVVQ